MAYQEALEVLRDQPACRRPSKSGCEAFAAIGTLDFDTKGAQNVDAPAGTGFPVFLILGHGRGDLAVYQPMATVHIVVVAARAGALGDEGADMLDGGKAACGGSWIG